MLKLPYLKQLSVFILLCHFFAQDEQILFWLMLKSHPPVIVCEGKTIWKGSLISKISVV